MYIKENYINLDSPTKLWNWGQYKSELKGKYENEYAGEVKVYKLSKKEMEEYLNKLYGGKK